MPIQCTCFPVWLLFQVIFFPPLLLIACQTFQTNLYHDRWNQILNASEQSVPILGVHMTAPPNQVFTSGFLCQLTVGICIRLNVSLIRMLFFLISTFLVIYLSFSSLFFFWHEEDNEKRADALHSNRIVVSCQGMSLGQPVKIEDRHPFWRYRRLAVLISASSLPQFTD